MENKIVKEIVNIVYDIYSLNYELSNFEKLRELSGIAWEENHFEILNELSNLDLESNIDFQLFWYDCMGFPHEMPRIFYKNGKPGYVHYGFVPSKLNECGQFCGGFHDANINHVTFQNETLTLMLDGRAWGVKSCSKYQLKLAFEGVEKVICKMKDFKESNESEDKILNTVLLGNHILSAGEIPMINYIFENLELDRTYLLPEKRLFYLSLSGNDDIDVYTIFDTWKHDVFI